MQLQACVRVWVCVCVYVHACTRASACAWNLAYGLFSWRMLWVLNIYTLFCYIGAQGTSMKFQVRVYVCSHVWACLCVHVYTCACACAWGLVYGLFS